MIIFKFCSQYCNIIFFTTTIDNDLSGEYWPASKTIMIGPDRKTIHNASAYIGDSSYSDVIEKKILEDPSTMSDDKKEDALMYLGYFIDAASQEKTYLHGIKDLPIINDASDTVVDDNDDN